MKQRIRWISLLLLGVVWILPLVLATETKDKVKVTGITRVWGNTEKNITFMEGNLLIVQEETTIQTRFAEVDQDTKDALFSRGVVLKKNDLRIESQELALNFNKKKGRFSGQVRLQRGETRNAEGKVTKDAFTLSCDVLEADTKREDFTASGAVMLEHQEFSGSSTQMIYDNDKQILTLTGEAMLTRDQGEKLYGQTIQIDLENKTFEVNDEASMEFNIDQDEGKGEKKETEKRGKKR